MTFTLLLVSFSSRLLCPRQHILGITQGVGFSDNPTHMGMRVIPYSPYSWVRAPYGLLRSEGPFGVAVEPCYTPGSR
jgi:hypothetical protein